MTPHNNEFEPARPDSNNWSEYRRLVTKGLEDLDTDIKALDAKFERQLTGLSDELTKFQMQVTRDIAQLQTKAGMWGGLVGAVISAIVTLVIQIAVKK